MKHSQSYRVNWPHTSRPNSRCSESSCSHYLNSTPILILTCTSVRIKYVPDSSKLPPPTKQTAARALKQQSVKTNSLSFLMKKNNHRAQLTHDTTRSMPASPSLNAAHAPFTQNSNPTSIPTLPNGKVQRLQAVRVPLIHFLAARPASSKLLAQHLSCKQDDVLEVLQKVGKPYRLDATKWDLTDKTFKELDIWWFPYPNQEDRDLAIGRARSAFDRMRLSTQEKLWDQLLPKHERGKGKILSQLNLHKGPIQQSTTPKIQIQHTANEEAKAQQADGDESDQRDRLAPSDAEPMVRSKSHGSIKRTKISEKEAQSKRLLSNGPKKVKPNPKVKEAHPAVKNGTPQKKSGPKSSEFVNDSDEEDGLEDAVAQSLNPQEVTSKMNKSTSIKETNSKPPTPSQADSQSKPKPAVASGPIGKEVKTDKKKPLLPTKIPGKQVLHSGTSSPARRSRLTETGQGSTAKTRTISRQRTTSSPHKPSPLGSSPPTNASDIETATRSSDSSTPMVTQAQKNNGNPNGISRSMDGCMRHKRKAGDIDSDPNHGHGSSLTNGNTNGHVNGNDHPAKRQKTSAMEPLSSDSGESPAAYALVLDRAKDFKKYYANYKKQYNEVAQLNEAPQEKVDALMKMHHRLAELKSQITIGLVGP